MKTSRRALMLGFLGEPLESLALPCRTQLVESDGLTFPVLTWGARGGRPIVLLHGFPQDPSVWSPVAAALAQEHFYVLAPWQRGYVPSNRPPVADAAEYTFTDFVGDVIAVADRLRLRQVDLVGFGIAGAQAWMVAAFHPERVRSIASIRYPHPAALAEAMESDPEQRAKWQRLQAQLGVGSPAQKAKRLLADDAADLRRLLVLSRLPQPFLDRYIARLQQPDALAAALAWDQAVCLDEFSRVPDVLVPSLLVWSEGPALTRTAAQATREHVRARYLQMAVRGGHFLLESSPGGLLPPLRKHLRSS